MKFSIKIFPLLVGVAIVLNLIFRFYQLGKNPMALYWDELAMGFDGIAVSQTGMDIHGNGWFQAIFPSYGDYKAPIAIWLVSLSFKVFSASEWALRLPFALVGLVGIVGFALLLREFLFWVKKEKNNVVVIHPSTSLRNLELPLHLQNTHIFILTVLSFAYLPWHFHYSRVGYEAGMSVNIVIWALLFSLMGIRLWGGYLLIASALGALGSYTYFSARYIFPLFFIWLVVCAFRSLDKKKFAYLVASIILFIVLTLPIQRSPFYPDSQIFRWSVTNIINDPKLRETSAQLILENGNTLWARLMYHRYLFLGKAFIGNYLPHYSPEFLFFSGDKILRHHTGWGGELLLWQAPWLILGLYWLVKNIFKPYSLILLGWVLIAPLTAALPYEVPHASRSIYLLIPLCLITYLGLLQFIKLWQFQKLHLVFLGILVALLVNFGFFYEDYLYHYPSRSAFDWELGNTQIAKIIAQDNGAYMIHAPNNFYLPVLATLFYNPKYIFQLQAESIKQKTDQNYFWREGEFANLRLKIDARTFNDIRKDNLYIIPDTDEVKSNFEVTQTFAYPDGKPMLKIIRPRE